MFIVTINVEKCVGCGDCADFCPSQLITIVEEKGKKYALLTGEPSNCIGCLSCQEGCPEGAIKVTEL